LRRVTRLSMQDSVRQTAAGTGALKQ